MSAPYEIIYYKGVPGRGELLRLAFEEAGADYKDTVSLTPEEARDLTVSYLDEKYTGDGKNPPYYAPPLFKHGDLIISQTSNILMYLGPKLGLAGSEENDRYRVNALTQTAIDGLLDEAHECHHPIAVELYWEDQKEESMRRSREWVKTRLSKHLGYWQKVLSSEVSSKGPWLLGEQLTYADLALFQVLDGQMYMFPKAMDHYKASGKFDQVFKLWEDVKARPKIAAYLSSERRQAYASWGVYRYYEENDVVPE